MKNHLRLIQFGLVATALASFGVGCDTFDRMTKQEKSITVKVPMSGDVAEVPVPATGSKRYKVALNQLAYEQWADALTGLKAIVAEEPTNWRAIYALAVVQEVTGDFANAKANYIKADELNGTLPDSNCQAGVERIKQRGH